MIGSAKASSCHKIFVARFASSTASKANEKKTVLILGKPGGGKGTISKKILNDFTAFHHLSTGDVLRQHVRDETALGREAKEHMNNGHLVPDEVMIRLVLEDACNGQHKLLLLDGFPRTLQQARALDSYLNVDMVINLDIPTETIVSRISDRWIHAPSGRVYSYSYQPPKVEGLDDLTGEPLTQREDDQPEKVRRRLEAYDEITSPLIGFYEDREVLKTFKGTKSDVIYTDVKEWLDTKLAGEALSFSESTDARYADVTSWLHKELSIPKDVGQAA